MGHHTVFGSVMIGSCWYPEQKCSSRPKKSVFTSEGSIRTYDIHVLRVIVFLFSCLSLRHSSSLFLSLFQFEHLLWLFLQLGIVYTMNSIP